MDEYSSFKTGQPGRIDLFAAIVYFPVPADEFEATEHRIRREMQILKMAGEDPNSVSADAADGIIKRWLSRTT